MFQHLCVFKHKQFLHRNDLPLFLVYGYLNISSMACHRLHSRFIFNYHNVCVSKTEGVGDLIVHMLIGIVLTPVVVAYGACAMQQRGMNRNPQSLDGGVW